MVEKKRLGRGPPDGGAEKTSYNLGKTKSEGCAPPHSYFFSILLGVEAGVATHRGPYDRHERGARRDHNMRRMPDPISNVVGLRRDSWPRPQQPGERVVIDYRDVNC